MNIYGNKFLDEKACNTHSPLVQLDMSIFDSRFSVTEQILLLLRQVNQIVQAYNLDHTATINYLNKIEQQLTDLDNTITGAIIKEIAKKILELISDGTLGEIINDVLLGDINEKLNQLIMTVDKKEDKDFPKNVLQLERVWRGLFKSSHNNAVTETGLYSNTQGFCTDRDGNFYIAQIIAGKQADSTCKVSKINGSTGVLITSVILPEGNHGNSLSYNHERNEIYFVPLVTDNVFVLDPTTLAHLRSFKVSNAGTVSAIAYDQITKKCWAKTSNGFIRQFNPVDGSQITSFSIARLESEGTVSQGIGAYNGLIYFAQYLPNTITVYDESGNFKKFYTPEINPQKVYRFNEIEDIDFNANGELLIACTGSLSNVHDYAITQIWKSDLVRGNFSGVPAIDNSTQVDVATVYVDCTKPLLGMVDGTRDKPFTRIQEVVPVINSGVFGCVFVRLVADGYYGSFILYGALADVVVIGDTASNVIVGADLNHCKNVELRSVGISPPSVPAPQSLGVYNSTCSLQDVNLNGNNDDTLQRVCIVEKGMLNCNNVNLLNSTKVGFRVAIGGRLNVFRLTPTSTFTGVYYNVTSGGVVNHNDQFAPTRVAYSKTGTVIPSSMFPTLNNIGVGVHTLSSDTPLTAFNRIEFRGGYKGGLRLGMFYSSTNIQTTNLTCLHYDGGKPWMSVMNVTINLTDNTISINSCTGVDLTTNTTTPNAFTIANVILSRV